MRYFLSLTIAASLGLLADARAAEPVDYLKDVRPILANHCFQCHGAKSQKAGLRVDTVASLLSGGDSGPAIVAKKSGESLLVKVLVGQADGVSKMPLRQKELSAEQIGKIKQWIDRGAPAPEKDIPDDGRSRHWAFNPPERPKPPALRDSSEISNPIDLFVRARLEAAGIKPSPEADRATLIRRVSLDLTGLLPDPAQVSAFVSDPRPDAYDRLVDSLLASPHHGERWGRHWLDAARYADSNGYSVDAPREIWKYRDWVIDALNRDLPFDQFAIEQLAGDLLPNASLENKIATGFHRNTQINQEGGVDPEQFRVDAVADRVSTTSTVFLGLTMACCRCHDHKYDPLSIKEFYQFFAFFNNCDEPSIEIASGEVTSKRQASRKKLQTLEKELKAAEDRIFQDLPEADQKANQEALAVHKVEVAQRNDKQKQALNKFLVAREPALKAKVAEIAKIKAADTKLPTTMVVAERKTPRETTIHLGGDFTRPGARVQPAFLSAIDWNSASSASESQPVNRLDLARWLVDPRNPLTARVTVNRIWQQYFGKGIVETENDFGTQGALPTHPELLDWLAREFMDLGWSMKAIHRLIVTSATYRQASKNRADARELDPTNRLLWRQNRLRLEAEVIRDSALVASGLLASKIGGPGVHPPQPDGIFRFTQVKRDWAADTGADRYRRGMYTYFWRAAPHPALLVFDSPDSTATCTRRTRSNNPLQALTLLNDSAFLELARGLAARLIAQPPGDDVAKLNFAFKACLGRDASAMEIQRLKELLLAQRAEFAADPAAAKELAGSADPELAAWVTVARVFFNLDEFITRE